MLQERLLERIGHLEENVDPHETLETRQINSIISHLSKLLNTRQGSVSIAPDFGVPDITNLPGENILETKQKVEAVIQGVVQKYEPRLKNVKMYMQQEEKAEFSLKFRLEANLTEKEDVPVIFETVVSTEGKISISS